MPADTLHLSAVEVILGADALEQRLRDIKRKTGKTPKLEVQAEDDPRTVRTIITELEKLETKLQSELAYSVNVVWTKASVMNNGT